MNQLARRRAGDVEALLAAGARLRQAQAEALRGSSGAAAVRDATKAERQAVSTLVGAARVLLADGGRPPTQALLDRVAETLRAAAVDDGARPLLEAGRLVAEVEPSGFGSLAALAPSQPVRSGTSEKSRPGREDRAERRRAAQALVRELRGQLREREREVREREREAERAEESAAAARAAAQAAHAAAADAEVQLRGAEAALDEA